MPNVLTWTEPDAPGEVVAYALYRRLGPGVINTDTDLLAFLGPIPREYSDFDITTQTLESPGYLYAVTAFNGGGESNLSNNVLITYEFEEFVWTEGWDGADLTFVLEWTEEWDAIFTPGYTELWEIDLPDIPVPEYEELWELTLPDTPVLEYVELWELDLPDTPVLEYTELWEASLPSTPVLEYLEDWNDVPEIEFPGTLEWGPEDFESDPVTFPGTLEWGPEDFETAPAAITDPGTLEYIEDFEPSSITDPGTLEYTEDFEGTPITDPGTLEYVEDFE